MSKVLDLATKCLSVCTLIYLSLFVIKDINSRFHEIPNAGRNIAAVLLAVFIVVEFFRLWGISHTASLAALGEVLLASAVWIEEIGSLTGKFFQVLGKILKDLGSR